MTVNRLTATLLLGLFANGASAQLSVDATAAFLDANRPLIAAAGFAIATEYVVRTCATRHPELTTGVTDAKAKSAGFVRHVEPQFPAGVGHDAFLEIQRRTHMKLEADFSSGAFNAERCKAIVEGIVRKPPPAIVREYVEPKAAPAN